VIKSDKKQLKAIKSTKMTQINTKIREKREGVSWE